MSEDFLRKICTSHFIVRVRKGLLRVLLWEGVGDRTELQYIDPHSYGCQRYVFLILQGCSTGGPGAHSAGFLYCILSPTGLVPKLHRGSWGPLRLDVAFPTISCLRRLWYPTQSGAPYSSAAPRVPSTGLSLPHLISNFSGPQLSQDRKSPVFTE